MSLTSWVDDFSTDHFADATYEVPDEANEGTDFTVASGDLGGVVSWRDPRGALPPHWTSARVYADFDGPVAEDSGNLELFLGFANSVTAFPQITGANGFTGGLLTSSGPLWMECFNDVADSGDGEYDTPARGGGVLPTSFTLSLTLTDTGLYVLEAGTESFTDRLPDALMAALSLRDNLCPVVFLEAPSSADQVGQLTQWGYEISTCTGISTPPSTVAAGAGSGGALAHARPMRTGTHGSSGAQP